MLILTSPAKTLDYETPYTVPSQTQPIFLDEAIKIQEVLKKMSKKKIATTLEISAELAELNYDRFQKWDTKHSTETSRPAIVAYNGHIYLEIHEEEYNESQTEYMQNYLRIISGLYGIVRPYDLIQPYRLEMKTQLHIDKSKDLYDFWDDKITQYLNRKTAQVNAEFIINLASDEYAKVIQKDKLNAHLINIVFNQKKESETFSYGLLAKKARGMMIDFMIRNRIYDIQQLETFDLDGYRFVAKTHDTLLFMKEINTL